MHAIQNASWEDAYIAVEKGQKVHSILSLGCIGAVAMHAWDFESTLYIQVTYSKYLALYRRGCSEGEQLSLLGPHTKC